MPNYRLGKKPPKSDKRTLQFRNYLNLDKLPPLPATLNVDKVTNWPMDGNDNRGDCVLASAEHIIRKWYIYGNQPIKASQITQAQVINLYDELSPNDDGLFILDILKRWRITGLWGDKIIGFAQVTTGDPTEAKYAAWLGSLKMGISLPDINTYGPWLTPSGPRDPNNGHDVPGVGYYDGGLLTPSWGSMMQMSWPWYRAYNDESYIVWSADELDILTNTYPGGFLVDEWLADIAEVASLPTPPPPPPIPDNPGCLSKIFGNKLASKLTNWMDN